MDPIQTQSDLAIDTTNTRLNNRRPGPMVLRMLVGAQLRRLREAAEISAVDAGYAIRGSHSKISRMELGRVGLKERDVSDLLGLYGCTDSGERTTLLELTAQSNRPGWWQQYHDLIPTWQETYLGLEQGAAVIRIYQPQPIPELLQTPDYAHAALQLAHFHASAIEIERRLELLIERQRILAPPDPVRLWAIIDEAALRRPLGGPATMRAQIQHLIDLTRQPHLTIQVIPFHAGGHPATHAGPTTILRFGESQLADEVYLHDLTGAHTPDRQTDLDLCWDIMNRAAVQAPPPAVTGDLLHQILQDT